MGRNIGSGDGDDYLESYKTSVEAYCRATSKQLPPTCSENSQKILVRAYIIYGLIGDKSKGERPVMS